MEDKCLLLFDVDVFAELALDLVEKHSPKPPKAYGHEFEMILTSQHVKAAADLSLDIPLDLLNRASIGAEVDLIGVGDWMEMWSPSLWAAESSTLEDLLAEFVNDDKDTRRAEGLLDLSRDPRQREAAVRLRRTSNDLLTEFAERPDLLHGLPARRFEELVAELFARQGFTVTLTQKTRDGGADLYLVEHSAIGKTLTVVECKRYAPHRRVGVSVVRQLIGVVEAKRATAGLLVTTSTFSRDAKELGADFQFRIGLQDYDLLKHQLRQIADPIS
jgi:DNA-binding transcriptional regulator/RsmH inhibitor MraZ